MSATPAADEPRPVKAFSCIRCFERKVKCDKLSPCSNCVKSKVQCVFRVPPAPRRKKKRTHDDLLLARLKKCEDLLRSNGIDFDGSPSRERATAGFVSAESPPPTQSISLQPGPDSPTTGTSDGGSLFAAPEIKHSGRLIVDHGQSRFIENTLWASLSDEFQEPNQVFADYSDDEDDVGTPVEETTEFLLGYSPNSSSMEHLHPSPAGIFTLWQIFLDNINPMTKFLHVPTMQKTITQACGQLDTIPRGLEALMFAIYGFAVYTIDDDECAMKMGEPRKVLLNRYRYATRRALARARFVSTSELIVLQALAFYLFSMREVYDARTNWTLAGVAMRVARGMGLHRDGLGLGLSIFETELRRRLWWQLIVLEGRSAELSGSGRFTGFDMSDTLAPTNVNDEDLYPDMKEPPIPQTRPTEMISCLLRIELSVFFFEKHRQDQKLDIDNMRLVAPWTTSVEHRDAAVHELEQRLEDKFLKYCDPSIPIQFMSIIIGRGAINMMRIMSHHPRKWGLQEQLPPSERELLWSVSMKLLEGLNMAHSSKSLQRFMWHTRVHFVWQALIFVLNELKSSTLGHEADRAWQEVEEIYRHHPHFIKDYKRPLHVAIGTLCLKAYAQREAALRQSTNGVFPKVIPEYIRQLREQRETGPLRRTTAGPNPAVVPRTADDNGMPVVREESQPSSEPDMISTTTSWENIMPPAPPVSGSVFPGNTMYNPNVGLGTQLPLPAFQTALPPLPFGADDGILFASEPSLAHDLALADVPLDWAQWDYIMQDTSVPQ
jgi:hypothetical protein